MWDLVWEVWGGMWDSTNKLQLLVPRPRVKAAGIISPNLQNMPLRHYSYSHFTDKEMEAWKGEGTCLRSYS